MVSLAVRTDCLAMLLMAVLAGCGGAIASGNEPGEDVATEPDGVEEDPVPDVLPDEEPDVTETTGDCTELVWYQDADLDGFGGSEMTHVGCEPLPGYVDVGGDCHDGNYDVHPGQGSYFTEPYGEGSFDYNCDGLDEAESYDLHHCSIFDCAEGEGWNEAAAPDCGQSGAWVRCEQWGPVCNYNPSRRVQACR